MAHTFHVVSHTHWDREWYLTYQQFRMRLVDLMDHLLELLERDPNFRSFHLDSQTIVLEDYLEIKPQKRDVLEKYIREGRIIVGPWYQLNDEFLTSGEATIRSLLVGVRVARQFGACGSTGYLPDQFGNLSQMPQIFRGFGFDHAVMGRGYQLVGERKMEFLWESPDGSRVTASLMAFWYNNAQHFPADPQETLGYIEDLRQQMSAASAISHLLLMNGVDHLEAQQDLSPILHAAQQRLPAGDQIIHSTIQQYIDLLKQEVQAKGIGLQTHHGEMRDDRGGSCLAGTLSTRMYIKQANQHAQMTLERLSEPFAGFAMQVGMPYPHEYLLYAWKLLMKNHPHDSICGCSVDQVHREMMPRFAQVEQIGEELIARSLQHLADRVVFPEQANKAETGFVVFNSLNWTRTDPVQITLVFPLGIPTRGNPPRDDRMAVAGIDILDDQGRPVPFAVIEEGVKMRAVLSPVELPLDQWAQEIKVELIARDIPACGYRAYCVTPVSAYHQSEPLQEGPAGGWRAVLEDCGDVGDEYLHQKPARDLRLVYPMTSSSFDTEKNAVRHTVTYRSSIEVPAAAEGVYSRSPEQVTCPITTRVTRWSGIARVEYETRLENRARDHRLRVVFENQAGDFAAQPYSVAEGQFDVLYRPFEHPQADAGASPFYPQQNWVALVGKVGDTQRSITVINQGLPEYEIYTDGAVPGIAVTLLRSVNYLSRRGDGPEIETPEAQCFGPHTFCYASYESDGDWQVGQVWRQGYQYNVPLRALQTNRGEDQQRDLPASSSFVSVEPEQLVVTAIKRAEDDPSLLVVRFFNISTEPVTSGRISVLNASAAQVVNLNEEPQRSLEPQPDGTVTLGMVKPKEIVTLAFRVK
jgi:alpha-mannosidase